MHSFLWRGITFAIFKLLGNIPVIRDWLIINVNDGSKTGVIDLRNLVEISSWPQEDFEGRELVILRVISLSIGLK